MLEPTGRTVICSTVFMDIAGYSTAPDSRQLAMKARLNALMEERLVTVPERERLVLDTGDGAAICFFGDPEDALFVAASVNEASARDAGDASFQLRTGIHLGPIKVITDLNGRPNAVGDGINVAQRIMSFADIGEVLVSRAYYEVVARLRQENERLFRFMGTRTDKHVREHQVYAYGRQFESATVVSASEMTVAPTEGVTLAPDFLRRAERALTERIGPLARVLVQRAAASPASVEEFCQTIAAAIPDGPDRASFLAGLHVDAAWDAPAGKAAERTPAIAPGKPQPISPLQLQAIERRLAEHIGPLAGMLVAKAAASASSPAQLCHALAAHIVDPDARRRFLADTSVKS